MTHHTQLENKIGGVDNLQAWQYKIYLILEENDLDKYISREVPAPERDEIKAIHKNNLVNAKRIIANSIKDHLIPHVSSLNTPQEVSNSLTDYFKGNKINQNMT